MTRSSHIPSLDGIRAVSILVVFIGHAGFEHIVPGGFGVTVFFFLSGYLITTLLGREWDRDGSVSLGAFYLRRLLRLGPPIAVTLAVCILLSVAGLVEGSIEPGTLLSQVFFYYNYHALYGENPGTVDGLLILWSLAVEEHFYLVWPACFILIASGVLGLRSVLVLLAAILAWRCIRYFGFGASSWEIYISTDTRFDSLLYGCLLALMDRAGLSRRIFPGIGTGRWVIVAALALLAFTLVYRDDAFRSTLRYSLQGIALMPLFHYAVGYPKFPLFRPLNWGFMRQLGIWSYSIYLIHFVVINGLIHNGIAAGGSLLLIVVSGAVSIAFAALVYRFAEAPTHALRHRLRQADRRNDRPSSAPGRPAGGHVPALPGGIPALGDRPGRPAIGAAGPGNGI